MKQHLLLACTFLLAVFTTRAQLSLDPITENSCPGISNGTIAMYAYDGTAPYTFSYVGPGSFNQYSESNYGFAWVNDLPPGTYTMSATDANGASASHTFNVGEYPPLSMNLTPVDNVCAGGTAGQASVTTTGGSGDYSYYWSNNTYGPSVSGLASGTHWVLANDNQTGCTQNQSFTITAPSPLSLTSSPSRAYCNGDENGSIQVGVTGGTLPYSYSYPPSVDGAYIATSPSHYLFKGNLGGGVYPVTVTDGNGCTATTNLTVFEPDPFVIAPTLTNVLCAGAATGSISVAVSGSNTNYQYNWSTGTSSGPTVSGLAAGTYSVTVTDNFSCTASQSFTITQSAPLNTTVDVTNVSCNGQNNGSVSTATTGGNGNYTYDWVPSPGTSGANATYLGPNVYSLTIADQAGCTETISFTVTQPDVLTASSSATTVPCHGGTADVTVAAAGGTLAYTGTGTFAVSAGTHTYTVTDDNGCTATTNITITEPDALTASSSATTVPCHGGTADVTVAAAGGTLGYTGTGTFAVSAGTHTYTVTDDNGCTATTNITITEPDALTAAASATVIQCHGETAEVTVTAAGGVSGYAGTGTFTVSTGTHDYTVTDDNGCTATTNITITEPDALTAAASATVIQCHGETAEVTVTAAGGTLDYTGTGTFTVSAGTHDYTVTDDNGCTVTTNITVVEPDVLVATANAAAPINCHGDSTVVTVTATGGTFGYAGTGDMTVAAGTHDYTVTDSHGCTATTAIVISEPDLITGAQAIALCPGETVTVGTTTYASAGVFDDVLETINGCDSIVTTTITMMTTGDLTTTTTDNTITSNQAGAEYQWIDCTTELPVAGATAQSFTPLANGSYAVIVSGDCSDTSDCVVISTIGVQELSSPNSLIVYPNPSTGNVTIEVSLETAIVIYDMLGKIIYTETIGSGKNTIDLTEAATGMYTIRATANGNVQLVKWSKQ